MVFNLLVLYIHFVHEDKCITVVLLATDEQMAAN